MISFSTEGTNREYRLTGIMRIVGRIGYYKVCMIK
jgi:hypothetical protein